MTKASYLNVQGVWKSFDGHPVLRGIDLEVPEHSAMVLIGASGSGKSTLLRCVNGLEIVDAGSVSIDGTLEVTDFATDLDAVRRRVGIVFQSYNLFPHMKVIDNITLGPIKVLKKSSRDARDQAMELLARFGLDAKASEYPDRLSGGQAQRVAIVRALAMDPEIMLFDEITSALDPMLVGEVLDSVRELRDSGMTIVMATHEMNFAREVADSVCFLHNGIVWEQGDPDALFGAPQREETQNFLARVR
ncbi:MAG: amino acid ABC transporter ATP-binding protein [Candidatus Nanopelagicales bacterium]|jgi:polar amino acid transport system ATP-binding protein